MTDTKRQEANPIADALAQMYREIAQAASLMLAPALAQLDETIIRDSLKVREEFRRAVLATSWPAESLRQAREALLRTAEEIMHMAALAAPLVLEAARNAEDVRRAFAEQIASMSEEEREELRRPIEDAPLGPVDVNAAGVM